MTADSQNFAASHHDQPPTGYLPTLDGWRAIAILLVLFCHAGLFYFSKLGPHPSYRLEAYAARGWVGVDIFFAISGFLISTLLLREQNKTGSINIRSFYLRRAFRILPPYLLYLAVIALLAAAGLIIVQRREWIACLLFFRNYLPMIKTRDIGWYTGHFWSLAVEEHFYLLWPAALLLLTRYRATWTAIAVIVAITIWRTIDLHSALIPRAAFEIFEHRTDTRLDSLLWGCIFAIAFASQDGLRWLRKWISPPVWLLSLAALFLLTANMFERNDHWTAVAAALRPPLFAAVVLGTVIHPQWIVGRILEDPRLRWLGRTSYSLYIWQQLFLVVQLVPRPLPFGRWQEVPLSFICILACAVASYYLVERPLVRLGHKLSGRHTSASSASNSSIAVIASAGSSA